MPAAATSRLVRLIHPLRNEPLVRVINGRGEMAFWLGVCRLSAILTVLEISRMVFECSYTSTRMTEFPVVLPNRDFGDQPNV